MTSTDAPSPPLRQDLATPPSGRRQLVRGVLATAARLAALAAIFIGFGLKLPHWTFFSASNVENIAIQSAVFVMAGLGMTMIIISGGIDLAAGSTIAMAGVATALVLTADGGAFHREHPAACLTLAVLASAASAAAIGAAQGLMITRLRLVPFVVTLGGMQWVRGLSKQLTGSTDVNGPETNWIGRHLLFPVQGVKFNWALFPPGVWFTLAAAVLAAALLRYTRFGRHVYAIGSNEATARLCGISVGRTKVAVYALAGVFFGLAGVLEFSRLNNVGPNTATTYELYVIAACVVGGTSLLGGVGTIAGTLIGALIIVTLTIGLQQIGWEKPIQDAAVGVMIIIAVALNQLRLGRQPA
jgi:ribose/xylose/arabinose/galactoside ABC-type transport system permease subunit